MTRSMAEVENGPVIDNRIGLTQRQVGVFRNSIRSWIGQSICYACTDHQAMCSEIGPVSEALFQIAYHSH
jgi:hypothetical protein